MTIIWGGHLVLVLNQLCRAKNHVKIQRFCLSKTQQAKRIGVYYMCIDDLLNNI